MSCKQFSRGTIPLVCKRFLLFGLLGLVLVALFPNTAKAEPEWCVRELDRSDERVLVQHNPECDLRILPRMYPQKDEDGKVLPTQIQLRSIFAANQTHEENGVKFRYTVMRKCVSPGTPSKDADAEELASCPKGLMNYFSAPASDSAARIVIPAKRQLTIAEQNLELAKAACKQLQSKVLATDTDKKVAAACSKQFTDMAFGAISATPRSENNSVSTLKDRQKIAELEKNNSALLAELAVKNNAGDKGRFIIPLFILLIGLAIFGATATLFGIKINREKTALSNANHALALERKTQKLALMKETREKVMNEFFENQESVLQEHRERIEKEQKDAWSNLLKRQQNEINALKVASSKADEAINSVNNELAGKDQQITELRGEINALAQRNVILEAEANEGHVKTRNASREIVALEVKVSELEEEVESLKAGNLNLQDTTQEKDQQIDGLRAQIAVHENAALRQAEEKRVLEVRVQQLLEAAGMCGMGTGTGKCRDRKQTLPQGFTADQLADFAKDINTGSMATDVPKPVRPMESEAQGGGHPENWQEVTVAESEDDMRRRAKDSVRPQLIEGVIFRNDASLDPPRIPLDLDPDEAAPYREEMLTLEHEIPVAKIVQEQMIHYRNAWLHLARTCAAVVDQDLQINEFSNVESVNAGLTRKLFEFSSESFGVSAKLETLGRDHAVVSVQLEQIAAKLRSKTTELDIAAGVVSGLREKMDSFAKDVKGNRAMEKIYAYQLATVQADARVITAEITLRDTKEELSQAQIALSSGEAAVTALRKENSLLLELNERLEAKFLNSANESADAWRREHGTDSGLAPDPNKAFDLSKALMLRQKDLVPALNVLVQLPDEELLRLACSIFHAIALKVSTGTQLEFPVASDADLGALRCVVMMPLVSDFPYKMPEALMNMAGHGAPRMYAVVHDAFAGLQKSMVEPVHKMTVIPPDGVPGDRNSALPFDPDKSQVKSRTAICVPSDAKDEEPRTA